MDQSINKSINQSINQCSYECIALGNHYYWWNVPFYRLFRRCRVGLSELFLLHTGRDTLELFLPRRTALRRVERQMRERHSNHVSGLEKRQFPSSVWEEGSPGDENAAALDERRKFHRLPKSAWTLRRPAQPVQKLFLLFSAGFKVWILLSGEYGL